MVSNAEGAEFDPNIEAANRGRCTCKSVGKLAQSVVSISNAI